MIVGSLMKIDLLIEYQLLIVEIECVVEIVEHLVGVSRKEYRAFRGIHFGVVCNHHFQYLHCSLMILRLDLGNSFQKDSILDSYSYILVKIEEFDKMGIEMDSTCVVGEMGLIDMGIFVDLGLAID